MMTLGICHEIRPCSKKQRVVVDEGEECECECKLASEFLTSLTEEILVEILIRLPTKCICRYKAVCKCWNSLISSGYFISRYIDHCRHPAPNSFTILFHYEVKGPAPYGLIKYLNHTEAVSTHHILCKSYRKKRVDLSFLPTIGLEGRCREIISIKASCHDLLLCSYFKTYYIVNLLTNQWIVLPSHPSCFDTPIRQKCRVYPEPKAGLLCHHDQNDGRYKFKVILAPVVFKESFHQHDPEFNASSFTICIFCSESKQWTEYVVDWYPLRLTSFLLIPMIAHNGMLHWHAGHSVVSFNPFTVDDPTPRLSRIINLPHELALVTLPVGAAAPVIPLGLGVCGGRIQLVYRRRNNNDIQSVLQVWQLKEEEDEEEVWHLAHNVLLGNSSLRKYHLIIEFIAIHPYNQYIIFLRVRKTIYEFNLQSRRCERKYRLKLGKALSFPFRCHIVPPLLHKWFPTPPSKLMV